MNDPTNSNWYAHFGEFVVAGAIAFVGWVVKTFTGHHVRSMDKISDKIDELSVHLGDMKADIRVLKDHAVRTDERLERLEG